MKKLLCLMALIPSLATHADDYPYLTFQFADGTEKSASVEGLTLTVSDGNLVAVNENGTQMFQLSKLNKMYFSSTANAIEGVEDTTEETEAVYDLSGRRVTDMRKGIYVVKQNGVTRKIAVK